MARQNQAYVIADGNLVADPEFKTTPNGNSVVTFTIAVNQGKDSVSFFDVEVWGKIAENCREYLMKGSGATIRGSLKQNVWKDAEGKNRSKVLIQADFVRFDSKPMQN